MSRFFITKARVTGIFQTGRRIQIRNELNKGDELYLTRDYDNMYDPDAIKVTDIYGKDVGYIAARENGLAAYFMDSGYECVCRIADIDKNAATVGIAADIFCECSDIEFESVRSSYNRNKKQTNGV